MYCPRCGQQQISGETKFCSRCGFQLAIVAELVANDGSLPALEALQQRSTFLRKKNGVVFSIAWFIFFTMFMTSVWGILGVEELAGISAVTGVFGGLLLLIGSLVFLPSSRSSSRIQHFDFGPQPTVPAGLYSVPASQALPAPQQPPAGNYAAPHGAWRTPETGELVERGSVTESTTKLLKRDE